MQARSTDANGSRSWSLPRLFCGPRPVHTRTLGGLEAPDPIFLGRWMGFPIMRMIIASTRSSSLSIPILFPKYGRFQSLDLPPKLRVPAAVHHICAIGRRLDQPREPHTGRNTLCPRHIHCRRSVKSRRISVSHPEWADAALSQMPKGGVSCSSETFATPCDPTFTRIGGRGNKLWLHRKCPPLYGFVCSHSGTSIPYIW